MLLGVKHKEAVLKSTNTIEKAGLFGRILRLLLGALLLFVLIPYYFVLPHNVVIEAIFVILGFAGFYILLDLCIINFLPNINSILGAVVANVPILLIWLFGRGALQLGALTFLGISLVLTSVRADKGCEVMSIPDLIFNRHTHLACFFFSPIDWLEKKLAGKD